MADRRHFTALAMQLGASCAICSFVFLMSLSDLPENLYYPLVLIPYSAVIYIVNTLFLRKDRNMRDLFILNGVSGIALFATIAVFGEYDGWAALTFAGAFCVFLTVWGVNSAMQEPALRSMMMCMEINLGILVFSACCGIHELGLNWYLPAICGCSATILGVMLSRMERSPGLKGWLFVAVIFLLIFALLWVLVSFAAAPAGQGVVAAWNALVNAVKFILGLIWKFILFLISLLPQSEYDEVLPEPDIFELPEYQEYTEQQLNLMGALAFIAAVAAIIGLVFLLRYLAKIKVGGRKVQSKRDVQRKRISLLSGFKRMVLVLWTKMRLQVLIWKNRNTPRGMLCILIRKCRTGPWRKQPGETPTEFLSRLRHAGRHDERLFAALGELIPAVERAIYAPNGENAEFKQSALVRRRIGRAVRGQFVRRLKKRIAAGLGRA